MTASASPPSGFLDPADPEGFRIALPEGWSRESTPSQYGIDIVEYRAPDGIRRIQVFQLLEDSAHSSVVEAQKTTSKLDGYEKIHLDYVPDPSGNEAAEHEYTADELSGEPTAGFRVPRHRPPLRGRRRRELRPHRLRRTGRRDRGRTRAARHGPRMVLPTVHGMPGAGALLTAAPRASPGDAA